MHFDNTTSVFGVRHGENLLLILFFLFLNDLVDFIARGYDCLNDITNTANLVFDNNEHPLPFVFIFF